MRIWRHVIRAARLRYMVERNCKLAQIGGLLDNKGYGIVMKKSNYPRSTWSFGGVYSYVTHVCILCRRREFPERFERQHIELAREGQTDRAEEQMVERETRRRRVSGAVSRCRGRRFPTGGKSNREKSNDARFFLSQDTENNEASELSMKNVGGVFIVLCSGVGVAAILASLEMFWTLWKTSSKEKVT